MSCIDKVSAPRWVKLDPFARPHLNPRVAAKRLAAKSQAPHGSRWQTQRAGHRDKQRAEFGAVSLARCERLRRACGLNVLPLEVLVRPVRQLSRDTPRIAIVSRNLPRLVLHLLVVYGKLRRRLQILCELSVFHRQLDRLLSTTFSSSDRQQQLFRRLLFDCLSRRLNIVLNIVDWTG